ncbi:MAG: SAM-dependent methyltransferase [Telluria sp.]
MLVLLSFGAAAPAGAQPPRLDVPYMPTPQPVVERMLEHLDPQRIGEARSKAREAGVDGKVQFVNGDLFKADLSAANVVTLYLLNSINRDLRPQLWKQLKVGTRVVSHAFDMGDEWPPERVDQVEARTIYYWTITEAHKRAAQRAGALSGRAAR